MALSLSEFRARFPEWTSTPDATVQSALGEAYTRTPVDIWGDKRDMGAALLASHLLAMLPQARDMRIGPDQTETLYMRERAKIARTVASGFRVTGAD